MPEVTEKTKSPESIVGPAVPMKKKAAGLQFRRFFTKLGVSPYDEIEWELRTAQISDVQGNVIFEQKDVEVPKDWSMTATNIVASKYLHGPIGTPERETGVRQLVTRVAETIREWGKAGGYFRTDEDADTFHDELAHLLLRHELRQAVRALGTPTGGDGPLRAAGQVEDVQVVVADVGDALAVGGELRVEDRARPRLQFLHRASGAVEDVKFAGEADEDEGPVAGELEVGEAADADALPLAAGLLLRAEVLLGAFQHHLRR